MSEERYDEWALIQDAKLRAAEVLKDIQDNPDLCEYQLIDDAAGCHPYAIYTYKAIRVCAECDTADAEEWLENCGYVPESFGQWACEIARQIIAEVIQIEVERLKENK